MTAVATQYDSATEAREEAKRYWDEHVDATPAQVGRHLRSSGLVAPAAATLRQWRRRYTAPRPPTMRAPTKSEIDASAKGRATRAVRQREERAEPIDPDSLLIWDNRSQLSDMPRELLGHIMCDIIMGVPPVAACAFVGVSKTQFRAWMDKGRKPLPEDGDEDGITAYREFRHLIEIAEAASERQLVLDMRSRINGWQPIHKILISRFPERWEPKQRIEHTIGPVDISSESEVQAIKAMTPEQLAVLVGARPRMLPLPTDDPHARDERGIIDVPTNTEE